MLCAPSVDELLLYFLRRSPLTIVVRVLNSDSCQIFMALKRAFVCVRRKTEICLFRAGVFGDSLGSFGNGVFCQFTGQQKSDGCLDFPTGDGGSLIVVSQAGRFGGNSFENVIHERIHDRHSLGRDTGVRMNLFQDFVNVNSERFLPALLPLFLVTSSYRFLGLAGLLNGFTRSLGRHDALVITNAKCVRNLLENRIYTKGAGSELQVLLQPIGNLRGRYDRYVAEYT